ncbi:MAG: hypothetical protein HN576_13880 [Bacteriovoracaceae bacterium]|jgi:hypothetical protein|nr:hypothetical protein [Bacteriovoracaceae bacterium]
MKNIIIIFVILISPNNVLCRDKKKKTNLIYKYKSYEKFDLGNLEIKGKVIAPGDLSVKDRARRTFSRDLFDRSDFNKEVIQEIKNLR